MPHIHDKIDFTVEVFLVNDGKVLLRKHDKYGIWLSVGGHIELDEDPIQAAVREVKEEVGIDVEISGSKEDFEHEAYEELIPPEFMNRHKINENHEHVTLVYFAKAETNEINEMVEREKSDSIKWFTKEELDLKEYNMRKNIVYYAKKALERLS